MDPSRAEPFLCEREARTQQERVLPPAAASGRTDGHVRTRVRGGVAARAEVDGVADVA